MGKDILIVVTTMVLLVGAIALVWSGSNQALDRAKQEYISCRINASSPEAASQCESKWKRAQDAYYIP